MKRIIIIATATLALAACSGHAAEDAVKNERIATSLESLSGETNAAEKQFVRELSYSSMSRPWWQYPEESMIEGYKTCITPNYQVALSDEKGWDFDDADVFVKAAKRTICKG